MKTKKYVKLSELACCHQSIANTKKDFFIPTLRFGLTIFEKLLNVRPLLNKFITQNTYQNIQFKHAFSNPNFPKPRG